MVHVGLLEDNARIAKLCAAMLHYGGHQVTVYNHPEACLKALLPEASNPEELISDWKVCGKLHLPIDVLILDFYLPEMNGLEVIQHLQESPKTRELPLILCSAASDYEVHQALTMAPHITLLEKPFQIQALFNEVVRASEISKTLDNPLSGSTS